MWQQAWMQFCEIVCKYNSELQSKLDLNITLLVLESKASQNNCTYVSLASSVIFSNFFFVCLFCHHRICLTISNKRFLFSIVFFFVAMFTHHLSWSGVTTNKTCATIFGYLIDPPVASKIGLFWWEELLFKILSKGIVPRFSSTLLKRKRNCTYLLFRIITK